HTMPQVMSAKKIVPSNGSIAIAKRPVSPRQTISRSRSVHGLPAKCLLSAGCKFGSPRRKKERHDQRQQRQRSERQVRPAVRRIFRGCRGQDAARNRAAEYLSDDQKL